MKKLISLSNLDSTINKQYELITGPWCLTNILTSLPLIKNPISDTKTLYTQSIYVDNLSKRLLTSLAAIFNLHYGCNFTNRYWNIVLSPFVIHWIGSNYFKYLVLKNVEISLDKTDNPTINEVHLPLEAFNYQCTNDYTNAVLDDQFIHFEFQKLARFIFKDNLIVESRIEIKERKNFAPQKKLIRELILELAGFGGSYYLGRVYFLSLKERIFLHAGLLGKSFPYMLKTFLERKKWACIRANNKFSLETLSFWEFEPENQFEIFVRENLPSSIPSSFLERIPKQSLIMKVKTIITNTSYHDQNERFYIARIIENGGKWFSPQHGGGYGHMSTCSPTSIDEYPDCDLFLTWGWKTHDNFKVRTHRLPSPMLSKLPKYRFESQKDILVVTTTVRKINFRFNSYLTINTKKEYRQTLLNFLTKLEINLLNSILYREHFEKNIYPDELSSFLKENKIRFWQKLATKAASNSKLVVVDHLGTTPLQTYAMNVPTIMFWPESYFDLTPEAMKDFQPLKECGLWFDNEIDAADFINKNYDRIFDWWNSPKVQEAKNNFLNKYAYNSPDYLKQWSDFIAKNI